MVLVDTTVRVQVAVVQADIERLFLARHQAVAHQPKQASPSLLETVTPSQSVLAGHHRAQEV